MWKCKYCGELIEDNWSTCWNCGRNNDGSKSEMTTEELQQIHQDYIKENKDCNKDYSHSFSDMIRIIGHIVFYLGIVIAIYALIELSKGGLFSESEITFSDVIISLLIVFYHFVTSKICIGIAEILDLLYLKKN